MEMKFKYKNVIGMEKVMKKMNYRNNSTKKMNKTVIFYSRIKPISTIFVNYKGIFLDIA